MLDTIVSAIGIIFTGVFGLIGWVMTMIFSSLKEHKERHEELEKDLNAHKVFAATNFATKLDVKEMKEEVVSFLTRIEDKLDKKVDK